MRCPRPERCLPDPAPGDIEDAGQELRTASFRQGHAGPAQGRSREFEQAPGHIGRRLPGFDGTSVDNEAFRTWVSETIGAWLLDMEGTAVAHVDCTDDVSFVTVRRVAGLAGRDTGAIQMATSLELAAGNAIAAVRATFREGWIPAERAARREPALPMPSESWCRTEFPPGCGHLRLLGRLRPHCTRTMVNHRRRQPRHAILVIPIGFPIKIITRCREPAFP